MADLVFNAADVRKGTSVQTGKTLAGENMTAGQPIYAFNTTYGKLADNSNSTKADILGVTINQAYTGQQIDYISSGNITLTSGNVTTGELYIVSNTSGKIAPIGDRANATLTIIGYAPNNSTITIDITATGLSK